MSTGWRAFYKIEETDVKQLHDFVEQLRETPTKPFEPAIGRFHQSFDRDFPEDWALDLFIALESPLSDDREAIRCKIALRGAHLIGENRADKINVNTFLKRAYDKRSGIVHHRAKGLPQVLCGKG